MSFRVSLKKLYYLEKMKRLFFAFWPENEALRIQCCTVIKKIPKLLARPVAVKNLHMTLLFLGPIDTARQIAIMSAADALSPPPMTLIFDQLNYWKKPGVLCLTSRCFDQEVAVLAGQLSAIAVEQGVSIEDRPFKPHVTLARKAKAPVMTEFESIHWRADAFCLVESCSLTDGVEYRVLKRWTCVLPDVGKQA